MKLAHILAPDGGFFTEQIRFQLVMFGPLDRVINGNRVD